MSHNRSSIRTAKLLAIATVALVLNCARLGEAAVVFSEQNVLPAQPVVATVTKPGMGASGGPATWDFWVKSRTAASDAMLGSFTPFYKLNATQLAVSTHFVLYRDSSSATMSSLQASSVLTTMESAYTNLKNIYGAGEHPYTNDGARVVILAYNIQDDYATTGNYVGGFFSPRDLYSSEFTQKLYTDPVALQQYASYIGQLGGYSNEMSIVHYDLNPGYINNPSQVNDIVIHELSHLFTYSKRVVKQRLVNHDLWIAEGIAENAPHATIATANVQSLRLTQLASPSVIDYYQDAPQLTDFLTWASKIIGYLQSNLFFNYLRHRAEAQSGGSGATMLTELMTLQDQSITGVETMIQKYIPGQNFASIYGDFVMTHYLMLLGIPVTDTIALDGTATTGMASRLSFCNTEIGISGTLNNCASIKARYPAVIPFNFEAPKCADGSYGLKPNSYFIFRHKVAGDQTPPDTAGTNAVAGELPIRYVINMTVENTLISGSPPASVALRVYDAGQNIPLSSTLGFATNDVVHMIAYNPNKSGSCRALNNNLVLKRNHSKWVGLNTFGTQASPDFEWQTDTGAQWANNRNGVYYRPSGIAAYAAGSSNNFLYISDFNNMSVQKLNMDTGAALGRLGNVSTTCPTTGNPWDTAINRYLNGYCAHNFDTPYGIHVDSAHNIYVADSNNRRIVKYDSAGNFVGWLGFGQSTWVANDDLWQGAGNVTDPLTLYNSGSVDNPRMFLLPWTLTSDATYLYVVDYGGRRIIRRNKSTGAFSAYIGNNNDAWNTATTAVPANNFGNTAGYFRDPRGIIVQGTNLYVVDESNHRIVRVDIATGNSTGWIGNGIDGWQSMAAAVSSGGSGAAKDFKNPSAVTSDGTYLYVADRLNNRISRWLITGNFAGWIGHGKVGWEMTAAAPTSDPYAGVSYYPPDYYAEPHGLVYVGGTTKSTKRDYLYVTSLYNGRVTRINIGCVNAPGSAACDPNYDPYGAPYSP